MVNNLKQLRKRHCTSIMQLIKLCAFKKNCKPHIKNKVNSDEEESESKNVVEMGIGVKKNWHHPITNLNTQ